MEQEMGNAGCVRYRRRGGEKIQHAMCACVLVGVKIWCGERGTRKRKEGKKKKKKQQQRTEPPQTKTTKKQTKKPYRCNRKE